MPSDTNLRGTYADPTKWWNQPSKKSKQENEEEVRSAPGTKPCPSCTKSVCHDPTTHGLEMTCQACGEVWCWICGTGGFNRGSILEHIGQYHGGVGFGARRPAGQTAGQDGDPSASPARSQRSDQSTYFANVKRHAFVHWILDPLRAAMGWESAATITAFHQTTRLNAENEEGLLVDIGAVENLTGSEWIQRQSEIAQKHGCPAAKYEQIRQPLTVEGVGSGSSSCEAKGTVTTCTPDHDIGTYTAPVVQNSGLPALLGLESIASRRALIDTYTQMMWYVGPGGYELRCSPGTVGYQLESSQSGHLLLPVSCWNRKSTAEQAEAGGPFPKPTRTAYQENQKKDGATPVVLQSSL